MNIPLHSTTLAWLTILALCCGAQETSGEAREKRPPSFVLILADDLGYGDLACYGGSIATPNIEALEKRGMLLTDFHSSGVACSPARAGLLTGLYPQRLGIEGSFAVTRHRETGLAPSAVTVAEMLRELGYATAIFGKWHLGYTAEFGPIVQGFDEFRGFVGKDVDYFSHIGPIGHIDWWRDGELEADQGYTTDLITGYGLDFLRRHKETPFFLLLSHAASSSPYQGRGDAAFRKEGDKASGMGPRGDREVAYVEMITALDEGVGKIVAEVEALGLSESTYVIFTSDNGPTRVGSPGPWRGRRGKVWEGGHRVPALVTGPGIAAGGRSEALVSALDFTPTMRSRAGGDLENKKLDGVDLSGFLLRGEAVPERDLYWSYGAWQGLRRGKWKAMVLAVKPGKEPKALLHDLETDPKERKDLAKEHPDEALEMLYEMLYLQEDLTRGVKKISG